MNSVDQFADRLFSSGPASPKSIQLEFDVEVPSDLFEILLLVMTHGMKKWYGERVDVSSITAADIDNLKKYFLSFGYVFHIDSLAEPGVYMIDNKAYLEKTLLNEMKFCVVTNKILYTVCFDFA